MCFRFRNAIVLLLVGVVAGWSSPSDSDLSDPDPNDPGSCESGPYFNLLPVAAEAINYFIVLGQLAPPGDVLPRGQTGLQLVSTELTPVFAVGDITIRHVESGPVPWAAGVPGCAERTDFRAPPSHPTA